MLPRYWSARRIAMKKKLVEYPQIGTTEAGCNGCLLSSPDSATRCRAGDTIECDAPGYLIPAAVAERHDRLDAAKDAVVEQLKNIKLLWDGGYIKATDDGLLRAETVEKVWEALTALDKVVKDE